MTDSDIIHFENPDDLHEQLLQDLASGTDRTPDEIRKDIESYPLPNPNDLESIPADEFYGERST